MLRALVFTVFASGFLPRSAKEISPLNRRFERIIEIIGECRYGIHDLCRSVAGQAPRNNMPLELGVFIGCWRFGTGYDYDKEYLLLDGDGTSYNQHTSDIKADDVEFHTNSPTLLIERVRDWLASRAFRTQIQPIPGADILLERYERFQQDGPALAAVYQWRFARLKFPEYCIVVTGWLKEQAAEYERVKATLLLPPTLPPAPSPATS